MDHKNAPHSSFLESLLIRGDKQRTQFEYEMQNETRFLSMQQL